MVKKSLKLICTLGLVMIPLNIGQKYSPNIKMLESIVDSRVYEYKVQENKAYEDKKASVKHYLEDISEDIALLERKREFFSNRLNERQLDDSIRKDYLKKLNETKKDLRKRYALKDSVSKVLKKQYE